MDSRVPDHLGSAPQKRGETGREVVGNRQAHSSRACREVFLGGWCSRIAAISVSSLGTECGSADNTASIQSVERGSFYSKGQKYCVYAQ